MERKYRKFKRNSVKDTYGERFKEEMNIHMYRNKRYEPFEIQLRCEIAKRSAISKTIQTLLSKDLQYKVYTFAMKNYWREMMRIKSLKPMWCNYKKYIDTELKKCIIDNIHFMHLDFNTLPEYKEWIPGCQCSFCKKKHNDKDKQLEYEKIIINPEHFQEYISCSDLVLNYWNKPMVNEPHLTEEGYEEYTLSTMRIYNPLKGYLHTIYDQIKLSPNESPIYFRRSS
tara:strand:+ start:1984 stop:2664 length:681 start_codon:yes stop_codon:yes gene_type:complete